jgi:DNA-binding MarR family transcriptional regulator
MPRTDSARLAAEFADAIARLNTQLRSDFVKAGVSLARARTLGTLQREGPRRLSDLAVAEQVAQPTMSALVARLEEDGLVSRTGDETDGRTVLVSITDAGRTSFVRIRARRSHSFQQALSRLSPEDRDAIAAALPALDRLLESFQDRQVVGAHR